MLFDLGWSEILLIGTVALIFIGPKDLPKALRVAGYWVRKARTLSREFQSSIDQMIREAELDEVRQDLKKAAEFDLDKEFHNTIDPTGSLAESLKPPELPDFSGTASPADAPSDNSAVAVGQPGVAAAEAPGGMLETNVSAEVGPTEAETRAAPMAAQQAAPQPASPEPAAPDAPPPEAVAAASRPKP